MRARSSLLALLVLSVAACLVSAQRSSLDTWIGNENAAAAVTRQAHFSAAEKLLLANQKLAATFPPKDARLPRTILALAVYRAEGRYSEALPLYEHLARLSGRP